MRAAGRGPGVALRPPEARAGHNGLVSRLWRARFRASGPVVCEWVRGAPGTYVWLAILLVTTILLNHLSPEYRETFLVRRSTNLHELEDQPVRVLIASALYIDGSSWWPYLLLYTLFHAPAERWLGTAKWLLVAVIAHVGATYISEDQLNWLIRHALAPQSARQVLDVGVSYALAGVQAVLVYKLVPRWRMTYASALLVYYGVPMLLAGRSFTDLGHFSAVLLGFACYPLTVYGLTAGPGRRLCRVEYPLWDPAARVRALMSARRG